MVRSALVVLLGTFAGCRSGPASAQRAAQNHALRDFAVASALIPVPAQLGDSSCFAVLMNVDLFGVLKGRKTFMPFGYRRYVLSRIRRDSPIRLSTQEVRDEVMGRASRALVERYLRCDPDSLLSVSFDARGLFIPEAEAPEGVATITALFLHGCIVSIDDESGVAYLDTGWDTDPLKDTHRID